MSEIPEIEGLREQAKRNTYTARRMHVQLSEAERLLRSALDRQAREIVGGVDWDGHIEEAKRNGMLGTVNLLMRLRDFCPKEADPHA